MLLESLITFRASATKIIRILLVQVLRQKSPSDRLPLPPIFQRISELGVHVNLVVREISCLSPSLLVCESASVYLIFMVCSCSTLNRMYIKIHGLWRKQQYWISLVKILSLKQKLNQILLAIIEKIKFCVVKKIVSFFFRLWLLVSCKRWNK